MIEKMPSWDLGDLYPSQDSPELKKDLEDVLSNASGFEARHKGKLADSSPEEFGAAIEEYEKLSQTLCRLGAYAYMSHSTNLNSPDISAFYQNIMEKSNAVFNKTLFFELEINALENEKLKEKLASSKTEKYRPWLESVRARRDHMLSQDLEKILNEKHVVGAMAWVRLFDETSAALRFDVNGKSLTDTEAFALLLSPDKSVRHEAGAEIDRVLKRNLALFSLVTNTLAKDKQIDDEWRGYKRPVSAQNLGNQVEDEVVDALAAAVWESCAETSHRFYRMKARWLGVDRLEYWDRNAPLPGVEEKKYSWEEARETVLDAYNEFSPEMAAIGKKFFDSGWIDAAPKQGKLGGAYAHPAVPDVHPYLMLNFMERANDVMTLAHELGHGVHQYLSYSQGLLKSYTPITLAETASIFGEMITFKYILKNEKDKKRRFAMLAEKTGSMLNTTVRQISFHEFETRVHAERRTHGELSGDRLNNLWIDVQKEALGDGVIIDGRSSSSWAGIPHLIHTPFYVYGYAFGDCLVNSLYKVYEEGLIEDFPRKYMEMLSKGGSEKHKSMLKPFSLDASKPDFWKKGLNVIKNFIDQLEAGH